MKKWMRHPVAVTIAYGVLALAMTWPLAAGLTRDVPSDLIDPLLNSWILAWTYRHATALLTGDFSAAAGFWNANIFHPEPLALAYSEHLTPQALQMAPVYAASGNLVLSYNLLFLSTYVLSGLGMFLLVREVTGAAGPAFIAGLIYAFIPYRSVQIAHLQVLSSQWMPFALLGLHRFFDTGRLRPLVGASAATLAQNLSCTYYLAYFTPFLGSYVLYEALRRGRLADWRLWRTLAVAATSIVALTAPFLLPYMRLRAQGFVRSVSSAESFSADLASYVTVPQGFHLWGSALRTFPLPEADLFPGVVPLLLGAAALALARRRRAGSEAPPSPTGTKQEPPLLFFAIALVVAVWLSLGPTIRLFGEPLTGAGLYSFFYQFVPGFDGLRAPARVGMIAMLFLAVLAGMGAHAVAGRTRQAGLVLALGGALFLIEVYQAPIPLNRVGPGSASVLPPPASALIGADVPPVYRAASVRLPSDAVLLEVPFGYPEYETQYMYYSSVHWRTLVNGYSGWRPESYRRNQRELRDILRRPEQSWRALGDSGATHVIVHEDAFARNRGSDVSAWLITRGARAIGVWGPDLLFELRPQPLDN